MNLVITDQDFENVFDTGEIKRLKSGSTEFILGPDRAASIIDALPRVIAERIRRIIPEDYTVLEIQIKVSLSGTPFGIGVGGDATVKFGPKNSK
jgi:hypothetical protein